MSTDTLNANLVCERFVFADIENFIDMIKACMENQVDSINIANILE